MSVLLNTTILLFIDKQKEPTPSPTNPPVTSNPTEPPTTSSPTDPPDEVCFMKILVFGIVL